MISTRLRFLALAFVAGLSLPYVTTESLTAQTYSPIYGPSSTQHPTAYCFDPDTGRRVPNCNIGLSTVPYSNTNGHYHTSNQPHSTISPASSFSDSSGNLATTLQTTLVGQAETIRAINLGNGRVTLNDYAVGYGDIYYNDHPDVWIQTGGNTTNHGSNAYDHWMTTSTAYNIYNASVAYLAAHPEKSQICVNDMALPFGGKFDINQDWSSPHASHDRGTAVDVAGPGSGSCPALNQVDINEMIGYCVRAGAYPQNSVNEGNHAHCQFGAINQWPH